MGSDKERPFTGRRRKCSFQKSSR